MGILGGSSMNSTSGSNGSSASEGGDCEHIHTDCNEQPSTQSCHSLQGRNNSKSARQHDVIIKPSSSLSLRRVLTPFRRGRSLLQHQLSNKTAVSTVCSTRSSDCHQADGHCMNTTHGRSNNDDGDERACSAFSYKRQDSDCAAARSSQDQAVVSTRTLTTRNGSTEALYCPREEARYLFDQGRQLIAEAAQQEGRESLSARDAHCQAVAMADEATEVLTQALSLVSNANDGHLRASVPSDSDSDVLLEAHILWTLVSHYCACYCHRHQQQQPQLPSSLPPLPQHDVHLQEARAYLTVLKPLVHKIQDDWIQRDASPILFELLQQHGHWALALTMSHHLSPKADKQTVANVLLELATSLCPKEALPHLKQALDLLSQDESCSNPDLSSSSSSTSPTTDSASSPRSTSLKQCIRQALVQAHANQHEWEEALSIHQDYMKQVSAAEAVCCSKGTTVRSTNVVEHGVRRLDMAQAHYDMSQLYLAAQGSSGHQYDHEALASLQQGLELITTKTATGAADFDTDGKSSHKNQAATSIARASLHTKLVQAQAVTLHHMGNVEEALNLYKLRLLPRVKKQCPPSDVAKIYYTMACLSSQQAKHADALYYYGKELKWTTTRAAASEYKQQQQHHHPLTISRIHHDRARIHDECLGNYEEALKYYGKALKVERSALKRSVLLKTPSSTRAELERQVLETQQCMGRIHYKRGEFHKALQHVASIPPAAEGQCV